MAAKKKKSLGLDEVAKEMTNKLEPAMNALGGLKSKKKKKPKTFAEEVDEEITNSLKKTKKPKPVTVAPDDAWTGSGWGHHTQGAKLSFAALKTGMIVLEECRQFKARNVVKIVDPPKDFVIFPDRKYGIFVDPKNTMRLRMQSDQMFCIWDFEFKTDHRIFFEAQ